VVTYGVNQASKVASKVERVETMRNRETIEMTNMSVVTKNIISRLSEYIHIYALSAKSLSSSITLELTFTQIPRDRYRSDLLFKFKLVSSIYDTLMRPRHRVHFFLYQVLIYLL